VWVLNERKLEWAGERTALPTFNRSSAGGLKVDGKNGCAISVAHKALPFLNEELVSTFLSMAIVIIFVPKLFEFYDAMGLKYASKEAVGHVRAARAASYLASPRGVKSKAT